MSNHLNSDQQLDQAVKEALESYEAPFDSSAWADMEKQLAAQPKPLNPFKKFSFSLNTIIAIGVVAGGLIIYKLSANNDHTEPVKEPVVTNTQPAQAPKKDPAPVVNTAPIVAQPIDTTTAQPAAPVSNNTLLPSMNQKPASNNISASAAQTPKKKDKKKSNNQTASGNAEEGDFDFMKVADQAAKSAPAFGDQIDPVRGFINPSSESANVKKEAYDKTSGWGDQVLRTMKPDTAKARTSSPKLAPEDNSSDDSPSEKTNTKTPKTPKKPSLKDTSSSSAEKTDSTSAKKVKGKNTPKYQSDKPIFEQ